MRFGAGPRELVEPRCIVRRDALERSESLECRNEQRALALSDCLAVEGAIGEHSVFDRRDALEHVALGRALRQARNSDQAESQRGGRSHEANRLRGAHAPLIGGGGASA